MGGNTSILIDFFIEAESSFAVTDFKTDFEFVKSKSKNNVFRKSEIMALYRHTGYSNLTVFCTQS